MYLFKYYPLRGLDLVGNVFFSFGHDEDSVSSPAPLSLLSTLFLCHAEADRSLSWSPGKHFYYFPYDLGSCITLASLRCMFPSSPLVRYSLQREDHCASAMVAPNSWPPHHYGLLQFPHLSEQKEALLALSPWALGASQISKHQGER